MSLKTILGWLAVAFIVLWVIHGDLARFLASI